MFACSGIEVGDLEEFLGVMAALREEDVCREEDAKDVEGDACELLVVVA